MRKTDNPSTSNFWFGFALGSITLTAVAYLIGTKKGREKLKQLIEYADTMHEVPEEFFALIPTIKEMLNKTEDKKSSVPENSNAPSVSARLNDSLDSLLEKVKHTAHERDSIAIESKKHFTKSKKE